jgi:hypothetical protein
VRLQGQAANKRGQVEEGTSLPNQGMNQRRAKLVLVSAGFIRYSVGPRLSRELVGPSAHCPSRKPRQPVESMTLLNLSNVSEANVTPRYMSTEGVAFGFLTVREPLREQKKEALRKLGDAA